MIGWHGLWAAPAPALVVGGIVWAKMAGWLRRVPPRRRRVRRLARWFRRPIRKLPRPEARRLGEQYPGAASGTRLEATFRPRARVQA